MPGVIGLYHSTGTQTLSGGGGPPDESPCPATWLLWTFLCCRSFVCRLAVARSLPLQQPGTVHAYTVRGYRWFCCTHIVMVPSACVRNACERQAWRRARKCAPDLAVSSGDGLIFVALAAHEDPELDVTIRSLLHAAARPERIVIGVVWQGAGPCPALEPRSLKAYAEYIAKGKAANKPEARRDDSPPSGGASENALRPLGFTPRAVLGGQLRVLELSRAEARGPCWARYLCELLWEGEEYFSQMDSHMRLASGWDHACIAQLRACEAAYDTQKPVLTCYGSRFDRGAPFDWAASLPAPTPAMLLAGSHFDEDGVLQLKGRLALQPFAAPRPTYFFSANFSFCAGWRVAEVPYDPQLQYLFHGEEVLMAVRLFTHGWDLFTPACALAFHLWEKDYRPSYDARLGAPERERLAASQERVRRLLSGTLTPTRAGTTPVHGGGGGGGEPGVKGAGKSAPWPRANGGEPWWPGGSAFGLGGVRSLASYERASGVLFGALQVGEAARRGFVAEGELKQIDVHERDRALAELELFARPPRAPAAHRAPSTLADGASGAAEATIEELLAPPPVPADAIGGAGLYVLRDALPLALAREAAAFLASLPRDAWAVADTRSQPVSDGAERVAMHFRRNPTAQPAALRALRSRVHDALARVLPLAAHERLLLNFSRYDRGDFLDTHGDTPSGSPCYERRLAFVWQLTDRWCEADGGLFVDLGGDAGGGQGRSHTPIFNALLTFGVPRMHRVTRVTASSKARYACYGWVASPRVECVAGAHTVRTEFAAEPSHIEHGKDARATAILLLPRRPKAAFAHTLTHFASLPMEEVGLGHCVGDYCRFIVAPLDAPTWAELASRCNAARQRAAPSIALVVMAPRDELKGAAVLCNEKALADAAAVQAFVEAERKAWAPCEELDVRDSRLMSDMYFSPEVKVFVFAAHAQRPRALLETLNALARALKPHVRIYLAEPGLCEAVLSEFGLQRSDAPTAVAEDTRATQRGETATKWRMIDLARPSAQPTGQALDVKLLSEFIALVTQKARTSRARVS